MKHLHKLIRLALAAVVMVLALEPTLPETGVLWWPVPVCIAFGLLSLILSRAVKGRKRDE